MLSPTLPYSRLRSLRSGDRRTLERLERSDSDLFASEGHGPGFVAVTHIFNDHLQFFDEMVRRGYASRHAYKARPTVYALTDTGRAVLRGEDPDARVDPDHEEAAD